MEIQLSKTLKSLRAKDGKTQDDLAIFLGISSQAVSKRERNEGYPDITLLPKIAGYFHITVDELLGVDEIKKQKRVEEITTEYNRIRHHVPLDPNYKLDEGIELIRDAEKELPDVFFFKQLLAADLLQKGKKTPNENEKRELFEEATGLCEDILARSTEDRWRDSAKQILLVMYADLGLKEKALELAYKMPGPRCTCEYMLTYIQDADNLKQALKLNAVLYYQIFRESILKLFGLEIESNDMVHIEELAISGIAQDEYMGAIQNVLANK